MVVTVALNPRFNKLNSNSLRNKVDFQTRERRALVDVTIPATEEYVTGGYPIDLSVIRNFKQVYTGRVLSQPISNNMNNVNYIFVPGTNGAASGAKLGAILINTGSEQTNSHENGVEFKLIMEIVGI